MDLSRRVSVLVVAVAFEMGVGVRQLGVVAKGVLQGIDPGILAGPFGEGAVVGKLGGLLPPFARRHWVLASAVISSAFCFEVLIFASRFHATSMGRMRTSPPVTLSEPSGSCPAESRATSKSKVVPAGKPRVTPSS